MTTALSPEQIAEIRDELVPNGTPVRFQIGGQTLDICTGRLQRKGINVIHQIHYWKFSKNTSEKISQWLGGKTDLFRGQISLLSVKQLQLL